ncbi:hypothetical protein Chor_002099 [Crotalus horridus]
MATAGGLASSSSPAGEAERPHPRPFLIGVSGGTASGKSTVCEKIMELLGQNEVDHRQRKVVILSQDRFYKVLTPEQKARALKGQYNFDHPDAFDNDLMEMTLKNIIDGQAVEVPTYDFVTHSRLPETTMVYPADVLLFEGILVFYNQNIRDIGHQPDRPAHPGHSQRGPLQMEPGGRHEWTQPFVEEALPRTSGQPPPPGAWKTVAPGIQQPPPLTSQEAWNSPPVQLNFANVLGGVC